ncbi:gamma-mobile-trio protein GmtX [Marinobacter shengliensis]|uniref:gamma-mobile-trio protein GmtX n=1 Tax=Marinobacter shengliensis TaxID=1389223 RepID=UPI0035BADD3D
MSDPTEIYEAIQNQLKSVRSRKSLEAVHTVCQDLHDSGAVDFRIATISKLGANRGVPSAQTIRNKTGAPYRTLIGAWQAIGDKKRKEIKGRITPTGKYDWVDDVGNPTHRYLILDLIAQVRHLKAENRGFASIQKLEIDYRPQSDATEESQLPNILNHELAALKEAISDDFLKRQGWVRGERGNIMDQSGKVIFRNGFLDVIEKLLSLRTK